MADEMTSHDQELLEYIAGVRERWGGWFGVRVGSSYVCVH